MHRGLRITALALLGLVGAFAGASLAPAARAEVGPLSVDVNVRLSVRPGVAVDLPPVGSVRFDTHLSPVAVRASIRSVDLDSARQLVSSPAALTRLQQAAPDILRSATLRALAWSVGCAVIGSALLLGLAMRGWRGLVTGAALAVGTTAVVGVATAVTFDGDQLAEPQFTGLISSAPYVQRRTENLAQRLESYRSGLADFVQSVTTLYALGDRLPNFDPGEDEGVVTLLHVSDIHLNPIGFDLVTRLVRQFKVEAVVDSGDLSTWGSTAEASFGGRIGGIGVPYVFVRGNHDSATLAASVARQRGAVVLDGNVRTVAGLRMAGIADPRYLPAESSDDVPGKDAVAKAMERLAGVVEEYNDSSLGAPVQLAVVHDPTRVDALLGKVPLILGGHMHSRKVSVRDGTRVMVEGTTGGAGITSAGLQRLADGNPLPLQATLLYLQRSGPNAGALLAYDEVSVGGLGLTSVSIDRTVIHSDEATPVP